MHGGVKAIPLLLTLIVVASSGCISDPTTFARAIPMVQDFLEEHPNAEINVVHYTKAESEALLDLIKEDCGKLSVEPKEYYFVNITDPSTNLVVRAWIDWESQLVECVYKEGTFVDPEDCTALYEARCFGDHLYWFDSCGNREDKKEYCPLGCANGECRTGRVCDVDESYREKPDCVCPDGYEMMVLYPRCADSITGAITGMPFAVTPEVADKAVTTNTGAVMIDPDFTTEFDQRCPDSRPVYRCVKRQQCRSHAQSMCYRGHVYWFDSCGHVQEKKEYCSEGCERGFCKERKSCESAGGYCVYVAAATDSVTGNIHDAEPTTASGGGGGVAYPSCREGYSPSRDYWCPNDGLCCLPEQVCDESDDGYDIYNAGCSEAGDSRLCDHCNPDGTLTEKYCEGGTIQARTVECPAGYVCSDAACVPEEEECFDSDGGDDYYTAGVVEAGDDRREDYCEGDVIVEYYCKDDGTVGTEDATCPHGCSDGACLRDGQHRCEEAGGEWKQFSNGCVDSCELARQDPEDPIACTEALTWGCDCGPYKCWNGETCENNNECIEEGEYMQGTVSPEYQTHCCEGLEGFDTSGGLLGAPLLCYDPEKGTPICDEEGTDDEGWYYPDGSLLVKEDCEEEPECTDSDGGKDYYVKGEVDPHCGELDCGIFIDECMNDTTLLEHYCLEDTPEIEHYQCPYGCEDGACLPEPVNQSS